MKILFTSKQITTIQNILVRLEARKDVKEFDVMYNPLLPKEPIVRYKCVYTSPDGGVGFDIFYICIDSNGTQQDCLDAYGDNLYLMIRDYTPINLDNPNIQVI